MKYLIYLFVFSFNLIYAQNTVGPWDLDELYQVPAWKTTTVNRVNGYTSILYESLNYSGNTVEVYAYYATPSGTPPSGGWPAVVFAHGGGGTAFTDVVKAWTDKGYAAISMDLEGHYPNGSATPNPGPARSGAFDDYNLPIQNQWYYHAVAQIIKAHSLIASFSEVNASKIGIIGASWGGVLTATVVGVDNRLAWAIPVYGAGYVSELDTYIGRAITPNAKKQFVETNYDGSAYFSRVSCPTLWINGTDDAHFTINSNQKSAQAVNGNALLRYSKGFAHSNKSWITLKEVYAFANQVVNSEVSLPEVETPTVNGSGVASVSFQADAGLASGRLFYAIENGTWSEYNWSSIPATITGNSITATVPTNTTVLFFTATDTRGNMVSSEYLLTSNINIPDPVSLVGKYYFDNIGNNKRMKSNGDGTDVICSEVGDEDLKSYWDVIDAGDGNYYIQNVDTQTRLQGTGGSDEAGVRLVANTFGGDWVKWKLTPVGSNWFIDNIGHDVRLNNNSNNQVAVGASNLGTNWEQWRLTNNLGEVLSTKKVFSASEVLKIYPNPAMDSFQLSIQNVQSVSIYTLSGALVERFEGNANTYTIKNLGSGIYIVKALSSDGVLSVDKLIKL